MSNKKHRKKYNDDDDGDGDDSDENLWQQFTGNCIVAFIFTIILGIIGGNLVFLAKIAARQGKPDCWGNKQDSYGNDLTLLDIYYPTDEEMVPYRGICPPILVEDYEQFMLGEYYPCGQNYDIKSFRLRNWWMLLMESSGFRKVGAPYTWINDNSDSNNKSPFKSNIAILIRESFIRSREAFKNAMFLLTLFPDYILITFSSILILPMIAVVNYIYTLIGGYGGLFKLNIFNCDKSASKDLDNKRFKTFWKVIYCIKNSILFILSLPLLLMLPLFTTMFTSMSLGLTYFFQPMLTDAHLLFNILRCNSKTLSMMFSLFVCVAASNTLKPEIYNTMYGVFTVLVLINLISSLA